MSKKVYFSTSLYRVEAVKKSVEDYQDLASFAIEEQQNGTLVTISQVHPSFSSVLVNAFCNHVLNETIILVRKEKGGDI